VDEDFYSVDEAARILRLTPGRIRQMLRAGELEGLSPDESGGRGWKIPMHAVHDRDRPARVEQAPGRQEPPRGSPTSRSKSGSLDTSWASHAGV
jgi:excisionase family DNA binding protein